MSIEELLQPRIKCLNDDWMGHFSKDEIITSTLMTDGSRRFYFEEDYVYLDSNDIKKHPHLFRELSWWEERKIEDMPEYVKYKFMPDSEWEFIKVEGHFENSCGDFNSKGFMSDDGFKSYSKSLPLTEQEYQSTLTK